MYILKVEKCFSGWAYHWLQLEVELWNLSYFPAADDSCRCLESKTAFIRQDAASLISVQRIHTYIVLLLEFSTLSWFTFRDSNDLGGLWCCISEGIPCCSAPQIEEKEYNVGNKSHLLCDWSAAVSLPSLPVEGVDNDSPSLVEHRWSVKPCSRASWVCL